MLRYISSPNKHFFYKNLVALRHFSSQLHNTENIKSDKDLMLVRDFINDRLYYQNEGYFTKKDVQLGQLKEPIKFRELFGFEEYNNTLKENYPENAWLTPSEIFKPYYGLTIGRYIYQKFEEKMQGKSSKSKHSRRIKIVEAGAGNGSAADSILDYFKMFHPKTYQNIEYTIVEISQTMLDRCENVLKNKHWRLVSNGQLKFVHSSISEYTTHDTDQTFVVMLELLDNLPHDRVYIKNVNGQEEIFQTMVNIKSDGTYEEVQKPMIDYNIKNVYQLWKKQENDQSNEKERTVDRNFVYSLYKWWKNIKVTNNVYLPTECYKMIQNIDKIFPNNHMIISDFDMLREARSARVGINAPIVSKKMKESEEKHDFDNIYVDRGEADIFFPTDFRLLREMYISVTGKEATFMKSWQFIDEFGQEKWSTTKSGYNPLKEDFLNTSFFVTK